MLNSTRCEFRGNFNFLPLHLCFLVRSVSCNLNSYYVDLIKKLFPNAKIIIDRFHIVQMLNRTVNSMRTDLMNRFDHISKNYRLFIRNWKLFLKRYDALNCTHQFYERSQHKWVTSERLINQDLELADQNFRKAYWYYQRLLEVIDDPTTSKLKIFKQYLDEVHQKYPDSRYNISMTKYY